MTVQPPLPEPDPVSDADRLEQARVVRTFADTEPHRSVDEADEADVLDQERVVVDDEDDDRPR